jgi:small subunit ribosomal protein S21
MGRSPAGYRIRTQAITPSARTSDRTVMGAIIETPVSGEGKRKRRQLGEPAAPALSSGYRLVMLYSCRLGSKGSAPPRRGSGVTKVIIEPDESFESALRRFKKQCEKAGLLSEFKKRQHYEKPSVRRKRKALAARKKAKRRERIAD